MSTMSMRDEFAKAALTGAMIATFSERPAARPSPTIMAELCYRYADAMMSEAYKTVPAPKFPEMKPDS